MPFSSLKDPIDLARAHGALDRAWKDIEASIPIENRERERGRLAYIVSGFALMASNEHDLVARAVERFKRTK